VVQKERFSENPKIKVTKQNYRLPPGPSKEKQDDKNSPQNGLSGLLTLTQSRERERAFWVVDVDPVP